MFCNTDCTIYMSLPEGGYKTVHIGACYWQDVKAYEAKKYGAELADNIHAVIPLAALAGYGTDWSITEGSYIARGAPAAEVTDSIEPVMELAYPIRSVTDSRTGSAAVQHISIGA